MEFKNLITLSLVIGFFLILSFIIVADIFIHEDAAYTEMSNLLVGALIGYLANVINMLYNRK